MRTRDTDANTAPLSPDDVNWDGQFDLPGANNSVFAIALGGSNLYVGGSFSMIGSVSANRIASWNSLSGGWKSLAEGVDGNVTALAVSGSNLFAGAPSPMLVATPPAAAAI